MSKVKNILKKSLNGLLILIAVLFVLATIYFGMDFILEDFISFSSRAVLSNFIVFALVNFIGMKQAVHPQVLLEQEQTLIENEIKASETTKEESEERLHTIEDSIANLDKEIDEIIAKSVSNAKLVGEKVLADAN